MVSHLFIYFSHRPLHRWFIGILFINKPITIKMFPHHNFPELKLTRAYKIANHRIEVANIHINVCEHYKNIQQVNKKAIR